MRLIGWQQTEKSAVVIKKSKRDLSKWYEKKSWRKRKKKRENKTKTKEFEWEMQSANLSDTVGVGEMRE